MSSTWSGIVDLPPARHVPLIGRVGEFDEARGIGVVEYGERRRFPFHCTAISDGSRIIAVGTVVAIEVSAGHLGRLEAVSVRPLVGVQDAGGLHSRQPDPDSPMEEAVSEAMVDVVVLEELAEAVLEVAEAGESGPASTVAEAAAPPVAEEAPVAEVAAEAPPSVAEAAEAAEVDGQAPSPAHRALMPELFDARAGQETWSEPTAQSAAVERSPAGSSESRSDPGAGGISSASEEAALGPIDPSDGSFADWSEDAAPEAWEMFEPTGVPSDPLGITPPAGVPVWPVAESGRPAAGEAPPEPSNSEGSDESDSEPVRGPDFWSIHKSVPTGPPPTWMTPVTPRSEGSGDSRDSRDSGDSGDSGDSRESRD